LAVDGVESGGVGNAGVKSGHTGSRSTTAGRKDIPDGNILNELGIEVDTSV